MLLAFKRWVVAMTDETISYDSRKLSSRELVIYGTLVLQLGGILFAAGKFSSAMTMLQETVREMKIANLDGHLAFSQALTANDRAIIRIEGRLDQLEKQ